MRLLKQFFLFTFMLGTALAANIVDAQQSTATQGTSTNEIALSWTPVEGAQKYHVLMNEENNLSTARPLAEDIDPDNTFIIDRASDVMVYWVQAVTHDSTITFDPVLGYRAQQGNSIHNAIGNLWQNVVTQPEAITTKTMTLTPFPRTVNMAVRLGLSNGLANATIKLTDNNGNEVELAEPDFSESPDTCAIFIDGATPVLWTSTTSQLAYQPNSNSFAALDYTAQPLTLSIEIAGGASDTLLFLDVQYFMESYGPAPLDVSAVMQSTDVIVTWNNNVRADSYVVLFGETPDLTKASPISAILDSTTETFTAPILRCGRDLYYWVFGIYGEYFGEPSNVAYAGYRPLEGSIISQYNPAEDAIINMVAPMVPGVSVFRYWRNGEKITDWIPDDVYIDTDAPAWTICVYDVEIAAAPNLHPVICHAQTVVKRTTPPMNVTATQGTKKGHVVLSWDNFNGVPLTYKIYRDGVNIANVTTAEYTDYDVVGDNHYTYSVIASDGILESHPSDNAIGWARLPPPPPNAVTLSYDAAKAAVSAEWHYTDADSLRLWRVTDGLADSTPVSAWLAGNTDSFLDATVQAWTTYRYWLEAGYAPDVDTVMGSSAAITTSGFAPRLVTAIGDYGQIIVSWISVKSDVYYKVYRNDTAVSDWITNSEWLDGSIRDTEPRTYHLYVSQTGSDADSIGPSMTATGALVPMPLPQFTSRYITSDPAQVTIYWNIEPAKQGQYRVWRDGTLIADWQGYTLGYPFADNNNIQIWETYNYQFDVRFAEHFPITIGTDYTVSTDTPAPKNLVATQGEENSIRLDWTPIATSGTIEYQLLRRPKEGGSFAVINTWNTNNAYIDYPGDFQRYIYVVRARKNGVVSEYSEEAEGWLGDPSRPRIQYYSQGDYYTKVRLTWVLPAGASSPQLECNTIGLEAFDDPEVVRVGVGKMSEYIDDELEPGVSYFYRIAAKVKGKKVYSEAIEAWTRDTDYTGLRGSVESIFAVLIDSVAFDPEPQIPALTKFEKRPTIRGVYEDPFKTYKQKRVNFKIIDKAKNFPTEAFESASAKAILLYDKKGLKKELKNGVTTAEYIGTRQSSSIPVALYCQMQVTNLSGKRVKINNRLLLNFDVVPPVVDTIGGLPNRADSVFVFDVGNPLLIEGRYFGKKRPKAWLEYTSKTGKKNQKVNKLNLKVSTANFTDDKNKPSASDLRTGQSAVILELPNAKTRKNAHDITGHIDVVIQTREGFVTFPATITETL